MAPERATGYPLSGSSPDEAFTPAGPRALYAPLLERLGELDLAAVAADVSAASLAMGVGFGKGTDFQPFAIDPVPRLVAASEWACVAPALEQRARALNAFLVDVYSEPRIFEAGLMPRELLATAPDFEPRMRGLVSPEAPPAMLVGMDLVRGAGFELRVLEDNLRMPSGMTYAFAAREVVPQALGTDGGAAPQGGFVASVREAILAAAPRGDGDPSAALLSDGPHNSAWYEHRTLGKALGIPVVTPEDLEPHAGGLAARIGKARLAIDVIYRRLDEERLTGEDGAPTPLGLLLLPPLEAGTLRCVNSFGNGIADDKLAHAHVEEMIGFYLGEEPEIRSVPSIDPTDPEALDDALERIDELVVKPREGFGGHGVVICGRAGPDELRITLEALRARPSGFIVQELVSLSTHPTVCDGVLEPRHVDLRPFVATWAGGQAVLPGGLTRFARERGQMVVNSSRGGGGKDTWLVGG